MKINFKKISAIGASLLLTGMSMGVAAAANYPAPFVVGGAADNVAIVYGTGAGVSALDKVEATNIQESLSGSVQGEASVDVGTDNSFKFEKTSTKYHLGDTVTAVISGALDGDELPGLLGDGKYIDNDNDEIDYTQKITMAASQLTMFEDNDYAENDPSVGFKIASGSTVMTYQLGFSDTLLMTDMPTTTLPVMGKDYYVLSNTSTTLTLLDSAEETVLSEGETITLSGKSIFIEYIGASEVKLNADGQVTTSLAETGTFKLSDGSYIGIKDIMHDTKEGSVSKVEFSLGKGKLKLTDADVEVQINDQTVSGLESDFSLSGDTITWIELTWKADNDLFVAEDSVITMPGFDVVSMSFTGLDYPAEETVEIKQGGDTYAVLENFPLKDSVADINILYGLSASSSFSGLGKDSNNRLRTSNSGVNLTFDKDTDDYFVISWSDGNDAESYLARFSNFVLDATTNKTDLQYYKDGAWVDKKAGAKESDTVSLGNAEVKIHDVNRSQKSVTVANNSANTNFKTLYSKEGLTVYLPYENVTAVTYLNGTGHATAAAACLGFNGLRANTTGEVYTGTLTYNDTSSVGAGTVGTTTVCATSFPLVFKEEDLNENKYSGDWINFTIGWDSSTTAEVEVSSIATSNTDATPTEILETDVWRDFTYSALASEILYNKPSSGQRSAKLMYHGSEVAAGVWVTSADAVITEGGTLGNVIFKDSESSSYAEKNVVVIGGSCINSAAATLLGGAYCGSEFAASSGVGAGEFLIKGYATSDLTSKFALLVAGYNVEDTVNAATYLRTQTVDTDLAYKGTSTTAAALVTETV